MRLSEAMMLGRGLVKFTPDFYLQRGCGCFIGMAGAALGYPSLCYQGPGEPYLFEEFMTLYPWLRSKQVFLPCCEGSRMEALHAINHLAYHVKTRDLTPERMIDWVRSVEPAEPDEQIVRLATGAELKGRDPVEVSSGGKS
jgi:hypothetical protein